VECTWFCGAEVTSSHLPHAPRAVRPLSEGMKEFRWLQIFADHAAVALANVRASAQIEELRRKLEEENEIF
jgi:hypothetical protein